MDERAILLLISVLKGFEDPPRSGWPQREAEEVTFSRWILEELLQQIWSRPWTLASETVGRLASELEIYSEACNTDAQYRVSKIAAETIWELFDDIKAIER